LIGSPTELDILLELMLAVPKHLCNFAIRFRLALYCGFSLVVISM